MIINGLLDWTLADCEKLISDYFTLYPEIQTYTQETINSALVTGCVRDMFGRRRIIPQLTADKEFIRAEGQRQAANGPIQMGAQGILKLATNRIYNWEQ